MMFPVPPGAGPKALNDVPLGLSGRMEEHGSMPFAFGLSNFFGGRKISGGFTFVA